jgi:ankyrin repeat protein
MTPLDEVLSACKAGDFDRAVGLIRENPSLANQRSMLGSGPIHAAHFGGHERVVELLLAYGVPLDVFLAAELGRLDLILSALDADPKIAQAFNGSGSTALHCACFWGQVPAARLLLDNGADPNAATRDSFLQIRPLGCAVATPDVPNPSDQEDVVFELVSLLLAKGADVNGRRKDGLTALHSAAYRGHLRVLDLLLRHGANPSLKGYDGASPHAGQTALDLASAQGNHAAAELLYNFAAKHR